MKLKHGEVVKLLKELGMETADKWPEKRLKDKVAALPAYLEKEEAEPKTADSKVLLKKILKAVKAEDTLEIVGFPTKGEEAKPAPAKEEKPAKKAKKEEAEESEDEDEDEDAEDTEEEETEEPDEEEGDEDEDEAPKKKKAKKEEEPDEDEDDEEEEAPKKKKSKKDEDEEEADEDDDEEDEEKPAKSKKDKKKVKRDAPGKGPGIIAEIIRLLKKATEKKPTTKKEVHAKLVEKFPDRNPDSMKHTVQVQIPYFLKNAKGLEVEKNDKGYWLDPEAEPTKGRGIAKKDKKSEKAAKKAKKAAKEESDDEDEDEE